jgi:hypothetical protein
MQNRHAAFEGKALFASVAEVQKEHATDHFAKWLVRVAEDDGIRPFAGNTEFSTPSN